MTSRTPLHRISLALAALAALAALVAPLSPAVAQDDPRPLPPISAVDADRIEADVRWLAADARGGRWPGAAGWRESRDRIADTFRTLGLTPGGDEGGFLQGVGGPEEVERGANVVGIVRSTREGGARGNIVLGAHYDHLGVDEEGEPFNGADDNASGTAALLEVARVLASDAFDTSRLRRDIVLIAFDKEEQGLVGSRWYAANPPAAVGGEPVAMICLDMLGRSVLDQATGWVIALGTETSEGLDAALTRAVAVSGDRVWELATEYVGPRSDFAPFAEREIPSVFFTTATHRHYHQTTDDADGVDYGALASHTRMILALTIDLATVEEPVEWTGSTPDRVAEARTLAGITGAILENRRELLEEGPNQVTRGQMFIVRALNLMARNAVRRGEVNDVERGVFLGATYYLVLGVIDDQMLESWSGRVRRFFGLEGD